MEKVKQSDREKHRRLRHLQILLEKDYPSSDRKAIDEKLTAHGLEVRGCVSIYQMIEDMCVGSNVN